MGKTRNYHNYEELKEPLLSRQESIETKKLMIFFNLVRKKQLLLSV
jgi:hypothetical protein